MAQDIRRAALLSLNVRFPEAEESVRSDGRA
jgi:hypothetical protein